MRFSANLGFLWADQPLPQAIAHAAAAGFDAVECHWPYPTPADVTRKALARAGVPMLCLNTRPGDSFGLAARPDQDSARAATRAALDYAAAAGAGMVHVMAGRDGDEATFRQHLRWACDQAPPLGLVLLIEPINPFDVPGYHLTHPDQAADTIRAVDRPNLRMMLDLYHLGRMSLDPLATFVRHRALIGHVQIAAVPDRGPPDHGAIDYAALLPHLDWPHPVGAEYRPEGATEASLDWLKTLSSC